ncbi:MAG: DLW-39 family protein [Nocardioides sp.]|nr:DLW-39 family protein [Nocardioides sp.]
MGLRKKKSLLDQANDYVEAAKPHVEAAYESAREFVQESAVPALIDAKEKAGPAIADAREKAAPKIAEAREKAAPMIASGAALAGEKATAAKVMADAKVAQLKGEPEPKKGSKIKKFVLFAGIAGAVAFVAKKLQGGNGSSDNWQSSYVPTPPPASAPTPAPGAVDTDDAGGSSPDEALADAAEAPHPVTTPDEPADVVDLDPETKP